MSSCKIVLENYSDDTYYAGSTIKGRLECCFKDSTSLRGIKLQLKCKESNQWSGTETYIDRDDNNKEKTRTIAMWGEHELLFIEHMLLGTHHGSMTVPSGQHVYPFTCTLPSDIPSSYKGPYGYVSYKLKGIVDRPMKTDYVDKIYLNVVARIDLNKSFKERQQAVTYSDEKMVCCCCCRSGPITMDVKLPRTAFVLGESVPFTVTVTNKSNTRVKAVQVQLVRIIQHRVNYPRYETWNTYENICSLKEQGVGPRGQQSYYLKLEIPKVPEVANFTRCTLFEVTNNLIIKCKMPCCTYNLTIDIYDIKLGHIPYKGAVGSYI